MALILSPTDRELIRDLRARGATWADIAPRFDVPRNVLSKSYRRDIGKTTHKPSGPAFVVIGLDGMLQPYCHGTADTETQAKRMAAFARRSGRKVEVYRRLDT
jgi:hypothetical protein